MVDLALGILHFAGFLAPVILGLVAVHNNPCLGIRQLQHICLVLHLHILGYKVAICMLRNKPPLVQGGHHHISLHHKITGVLVIKKLIALYCHRHILGGVQGLTQLFLHLVGIQQKLLLVFVQGIFPGIAPAIFHIVQNSRIRIAFTIINCLCPWHVQHTAASSKSHRHSKPGSQPANFFLILQHQIILRLYYFIKKHTTFYNTSFPPQIQAKRPSKREPPATYFFYSIDTRQLTQP